MCITNVLTIINKFFASQVAVAEKYSFRIMEIKRLFEGLLGWSNFIENDLGIVFSPN